MNIVLVPKDQHDSHMLMATGKLDSSEHSSVIVQLLGGSAPTFKNPSSRILSVMRPHPKAIPRVLRVKSYGKSDSVGLSSDFRRLSAEHPDPTNVVALYLLVDPSLRKLSHELANDLDLDDSYRDQINLVEVSHLHLA